MLSMKMASTLQNIRQEKPMFLVANDSFIYFVPFGASEPRPGPGKRTARRSAAWLLSLFNRKKH
jgi:hypothetical protein